MTSEKADKKLLIRLKEAIRFEYTPETMATLLVGEVGLVESSTEEHHVVVFAKNSIVPQRHSC